MKKMPVLMKRPVQVHGEAYYVSVTVGSPIELTTLWFTGDHGFGRHWSYGDYIE